MDNYNQFNTRIKEEFYFYKKSVLSMNKEAIFMSAYAIAKTGAIADFFNIGEECLINALGKDIVEKLYLFQGDVLSSICNEETRYEKSMWVDYDDLAEVIINFVKHSL